MDKPDDDFHKRADRPSGRASECKACNLERTREYRARHPGRQEALNRRYGRELREQAIEAYGGRCACCGEERYEFLAIDHVDGGGTAHRREHSSNSGVVRELRRLGWPPGYRVLCHNCNSALGFYGYCPHTGGSVTTQASHDPAVSATSTSSGK